MRGLWGALTLALVGIIIADLAAHPKALTAGATGLHNLIVPTYSAMLGVAPK